MLKRTLLSAGVLLSGAAPAFAHLDPVAHGSFLAGVSHPLFGLDHILAMVAVGLFAAQIGGRGLLAVPAAFVAVMAGGFALALAGLSLPFVEPAILASVVVLGLLVATAAKLPVGASVAIVGSFALFHGHAHAGELGAAGALRFGAGFALSTALLHASGLAAGLALGLGQGLGNGLGRGTGFVVARLAGAATAVTGLVLMAG